MAFARGVARFSRACGVRAFSSTSTPAATLQRTALYQWHVDHGGKMVPFAGYELPVQYKDSLINSHLHCRKGASLFDVSHMGQVLITGTKRKEFLEKLIVGDILSLGTNQSRLSLITNECGGIIDDCMLTNKEDHIYLVVNAGCKYGDLGHIYTHLAAFNAAGGDVEVRYVGEERSLLALQGPQAAEVLQRHLPSSFNLSKLPFMFTTDTPIDGLNTWISRCGYTGEDGFEISVPAKDAVKLADLLLGNKEVSAAGLGVRDSLRLEAGLCLYGHDLNNTITPIEATLAWTISKRRREQGGFLGAEVIQKQLKEGVSRKRVGLNILKGAPAREGAEILDDKGNKIGTITSGTFSPVLQRPVSMGYVDTKFSKAGTKVSVSVRGRINDAEITTMPFVPTRYYKPS